MREADPQRLRSTRHTELTTQKHTRTATQLRHNSNTCLAAHFLNCAEADLCHQSFGTEARDMVYVTQAVSFSYPRPMKDVTAEFSPHPPRRKATTVWLSDDLTIRTEHPDSVGVETCGLRNGVAQRFGRRGEEHG